MISRRFGAAVGAAAAVVGLLAGIGVAGDAGRALANPVGGAPVAFVGGSGGQLDRLNATDLAPGSSTPVGAPIVSVAVNATATKVILGLKAASAGSPPAIAVEDVGGGPVAQVATAADPVGIAADPTDASRAFVLESNGQGQGNVHIVGIDSNPPDDSQPTLSTGRVLRPTAIAVSPDAAHVFVSGVFNGPAVVAIPTSTGPSKPWTFASQSGEITDVVVSPDGAFVYATVATATPAGAPAGFLLAISSNFTSYRWQPQPIKIAVPKCLTVSPDGSTVYVCGNDGAGPGPSMIAAFDTTSGNSVGFQQVPIGSAKGTGGAVTVAETPDGSALLVAGTDATSNSSVVYRLNLPSLSLSPGAPLSPNFGTLAGPEQLAITPDQAPAAALTATPGSAGTPTSFSAAGSSVAYGSVNQFAWDFGDGQSAATGSPAAAHTYASAGTYVVTLTETDSAGTTVPPAVPGTPFAVDGPGQTAYRRADTSARTTLRVTITPRGVPPATVPGGGPPTTAPAAGKPVLTLNPAVGTPGTLVTVTGTGFPASTPITVAWSTSTGSVVIPSDSHGNLPPTILAVLVPDVLGPRSAVAAGSGVSAPFLVVPGTAQPGGGGASFLFRTEGP